LNTDSEKSGKICRYSSLFILNIFYSGFVVFLNNTPLDFHQVRGVTKKQIFFNSCPNTISGQNYLNVKILKKSISETIKQNLNPYDGLVEKMLLNVNVNYVESKSEYKRFFEMKYRQ
jgi:hypothetical protein